MSTIHAPFRADFVGSFLRPAELKEARANFASGKISAEDLKNVEDKLITELVKKQKAHGLHVITDGEFRRSYWHLDFFWGFNGIEHIELEHGYKFHGIETKKGSIQITGKISGTNHPFVNHYKFVKQFEEEGIIAKQTIPAPAQLWAELFRGDNGKNTNQFYPDKEVLIQDIAKAYHETILELYQAGCRTIQLDDCTWGMIIDKDYWKARGKTEFSIEDEAALYLRLNNLAIENLPEDLVINTHVCRGNYNSCFASQGAYDPVAPYLFAKENVNAFYLEYDDERSGSFDALKFVPKNKKVVLGLITSKSPKLEDRNEEIKRIHEASKFVTLDNLYLSPQCGFASCEIGNRLTEDEQWAKLDLVKSIADEVWG
ncbi:MAG: 5-methyltetrahydropteroyltriglutamate--homocysteine S-methyltransferase [Hallerella porci]|uniref:Methionine synthase II (Cobalamin-independent) n=1 Tax=Hallerella porci TaxID=1945871 RepID=A0ABX5LNW9_9BACT|nr:MULTISPECIES: 5-methyltetrahydropteroyltriglutamate--homocysteine S-methyltransferase [Hallerella]MCI5600870.1 5-methyltetrahydropteroyltriglutamate--homocysteine S-methyltransferase [Hallerella sp.]MDY3922034.1 5-methyltetrahydropteroyltriglutamate--homocysteine S-methyltransferase [Hallerella porci]PWL01153.1 methionine synthase II (cobalamin-independent) [Hallerella porci]